MTAAYTPIRERPRAITAIVSAQSLVMAQSIAYALPVSGQVSGGQATITSSGSQLTIDQSTSHALLDWQQFNIDSGEAVRFNQPSTSAIALNRIHDAQASRIDGLLSANGQVWLVNPNGVFFGQGAHVNVGGLMATTSDIDNSRFMNGDYRFDIPGDPNAAIINAGTITAADGGTVALSADRVVNNGIIEARLGKVRLASGDVFTLDLDGDGLISVQASDAITQQVIENTGTIEADGGSVLLTAGAARNNINSLINLDGLLEADTVGNRQGSVTAYAQGSNAVQGNVEADKGQKTGDSMVLANGTISTRGQHAGEKGGTIEVLGDHVAVMSTAKIDASGKAGGGTVRVGGDYHGEGVTPTASKVIVQENANIYANALENGDGGRVTVWADDTTWYSGHIEAEGGANGGNGGFVETSGKINLAYGGTVNANGPHGINGTLLLDPRNVTISTGANSNQSGDPTFSATGDNAVVNTTSIQTDLNAGTNVEVNTGATGAQAGNITVSNAVTKTAGGDATLMLKAANDITVNAAISSSSNKLNIVLNSDSDASGAGGIVVAAALTSNGGNITLGGGNGSITGVVLNADGTVNTAAVGFARGDAGSAYGVYINGVTVNAGGGNVVINGIANTSNAAGQYGVYVNAGTVQTSGSGTINISGTGGAGTGGSDIGTYIHNASTIANSGTGATYIYGLGGGSAADVIGSNMGIAGDGTSTIQSTAVGGGSIILSGVGGTSNTGASNFGIEIGNDNNGGNDLVISSAGGAIMLKGTGGTGSGGGDHGVAIDNGSVTGTGSAAITITGNSNGTGGGNLGVEVRGFGGADAKATTVNGDIHITGDATAASGGGDLGTNIRNTTTGVKTTGSGSIYITGNSADNEGLAIDTSPVTGTSTGNISLGGTSIYLTGSTVSTNSGTIGLTSTGSSGITTDNSSGASTIGGAGTSGDITLTGDAATLASLTIRSTGNYVVKPYTSSTTIGLGTGAGTLNLTSAELGFFNTGATSLTIGSVTAGDGNATSGDMQVKYAGGFLAIPTVNLIAGGNFSELTTALTKSSGATSTLNVYAKGNISIAKAISSSSNGLNLLFQSDYDGDGSGYFTNTDTISSNGGSITVGGGSAAVSAGSGFAVGNGGQATGVKITKSIDAAGGSIIVNGQGYNTTTNGNIGVEVTGASVALTTSGAGTINVAGVGKGTSNSATSYGVEVDTGGSISAASNVTVTGTGGGAGTGTNNYGVFVTGANSTIKTTGAGTLTVNGIRGGGDAATNYGLDVAVASGLNTTSSGSIVIGTDTVKLNEANDINSVANLTIAQYTNGNSIGIGTGTGTLGLTDTYLGYLTLGGSNTLTIGNGNSGAVDFNDSGRTFATALTIASGTGITLDSDLNINNKAVTLSGAVTLGGANRTITTSGGSDTFGSTVDGSASHYGLTVANTGGSVTFTGNVGGTTSLSAVSVSGSGAITIGGNVTTSGTQSYTGAVTLGGDDTLTTTNSNVTFGSTVNGAHSLTVAAGSGTTHFTGAVGDSTALTGVNVSGSGGITLDNNIITSNAAITLTGAVTLGGHSTLAAGSGTITFGSTVNGAKNLTATAGTFSLGGNLGGTTPLSAVSLTSTNGVTLPSITAGSIFVRTTDAAADVTIANGKTLTASDAGDAVVVASGRNFVNNSGSNSPFTANNGRFIGYSHKKADDTNTVTHTQEITGFDYSGLPPSSIVPATYSGTQTTWVYDVASGTITITADNKGMTYGGVVPAFTYQFSCSDGCGQGVMSGALATNATTSTSGNYNAGTWDILIGTLTANNGYTINFTQGTLTVSAKALTISGMTADNKVYDATNTATLHHIADSLNGVVNGFQNGGGGPVDVVTFDASGATGTFNNANVGNGKTVTAAGITLGGADAANYSLTQPTTTADIAPRGLSITASNVTGTYGSAAANSLDGATGFNAVGLQGGQTVGSVTLATNATSSTSNNYNAGIWAITPSAATGGTFDINNYAVTYNNGVHTVNAKTLTVGGVTATNKVYDGTTGDTLNTAGDSLTGVVAGHNNAGGTSDVVTLSNAGATGTFADANVGNGKAVTASGFSISGADAANYSLTQPAGLTANITARGLTITATDQSKTYGFGGNSAALGTSGFNAVGLQNGETVGGVTLSTNATTSTSGNYNAGTWTITPSLAVGGTFDSNNYTVTYNNAPTGLTIAQKAATISGMTAGNKVYDGTIAATIDNSADTVNGVIGGDVVTVNAAGATGIFSDKNIGVGKTVTAAGVALAGADAGNYTLSSQPTATANITARAITVTADAQSATYGDTLQALTYQLTAGALQGTDSYAGALTTASGGAGTVLKHANGFDVVGSPFAILQGTLAINDGNGGNNYTLTYVGGNVTLSAKAITVASGVTADNKSYDGTTAATLTYSAPALAGVVAGDTVSLDQGSAYTADFNNATVGNGKPVTVAGLGLTGAQGGDYTLTQPALTANITARGLSITASNVSMVYADGTTLDGATGFSSVGLQNGETIGSVTLATNATTSTSGNWNTGTWTITPSAAAGGTFNAGNYTITYNNAPAGLTVTAKALTVNGVAASNKVYDGTTADTPDNSGASLAGVVAGDAGNVTITGGTGAFADKNTGLGKVVSFAGYGLAGSAAGNYSLVAQPANSAADITARPVTVTAANLSKAEGAADPALTYGYTALAAGDTSAVFSGALTRDPGEATGTYSITQGTLAVNSNYSLGFNPGTLTISTASQPTPPPAVINGQAGLTPLSFGWCNTSADDTLTALCPALKKSLYPPKRTLTHTTPVLTVTHSLRSKESPAGD